MKAMPRTRVSLNPKAHQLGWLKTKKNLKIPLVLITYAYPFFD